MIAIAAGVSVDKTSTRRAQDAHGGYKDREDDEDHDIVIAQKFASFRRWR